MDLVKSHYYHIVSDQRSSGTATNMVVKEIQALQQVRSLRLYQVILPYTWYPVNSNYNTLLVDVNNSGSYTTVTIPNGVYSIVPTGASSITLALKTALDAALAPRTYTVSISSLDYKITITQDSGVFKIDKVNSGLKYILGFDTSVTSTNLISFTGDGVINLSGTNWVDIISTRLTQGTGDSYTSDPNRTSGNVLSRVPCGGWSWGQTIVYSPRYHQIMYDGKKAGQIDIKLVDQWGNVIDLNGSTYALKLKLHTNEPIDTGLSLYYGDGASVNSNKN